MPTSATPTSESTSTSDKVRLTYFMLVRTTPHWLSLSPDDRFKVFDEVITPALAAHPEVTMRFYDTEAFNSRATDVIVWETEEIMAYQAIVESLRESKWWGTYFEVVEILPGIENAYVRHYNRQGYGTSRVNITD
jgi:hypothetical protein